MLYKFAALCYTFLAEYELLGFGRKRFCDFTFPFLCFSLIGKYY